MLGWMINGGEVAVWGLAVFLLVRWIDLERELFSKGDWRYVE
jgi:hypothetical protein